LNKTIFDGVWENSNLITGHCTYPNGEMYEGDWINGKAEGIGKKTWPDERKYQGEFFDGKPCGTGTKMKEGEPDIKGYWAGGKFFAGEPPEGILEKQREELKQAK